MPTAVYSSEIRRQPFLARISGNPFVMLHTNTMHHLNLRLMTILYEGVNAKTYLKAQNEIIGELLAGNINVEKMKESLLTLFNKHAKNVNKFTFKT